jgi:NAD(P)-dependent dehydrogenase (short-subunit alcohol dehydrogenase family)
MNVKFDFSNQTVVITGSATGLGRGMAKEFAKAGANVAVCDINQVKGQETVADITAAGGNSKFYYTNVTDQENVEQVKNQIVKDFGTVDVLVNCAGSGPAKGKVGPPMAKADIADWKRMVDLNLIGAVIVTKAFGCILKDKKSGKIVNISSQAAYNQGTSMPHYNATKIALISYTQSCSIEFGAYNINVNAVCPGFIHTAHFHEGAEEFIKTMPALFGHMKTPQEVVDAIASRTSLKRCQTPEQIAHAVMFLSSDIASEITGQALIVDSGGIRR